MTSCSEGEKVICSIERFIEKTVDEAEQLIMKMSCRKKNREVNKSEKTDTSSEKKKKKGMMLSETIIANSHDSHHRPHRHKKSANSKLTKVDVVEDKEKQFNPKNNANHHNKISTLTSKFELLAFPGGGTLDMDQDQDHLFEEVKGRSILLIRKLPADRNGCVEQLVQAVQEMNTLGAHEKRSMNSEMSVNDSETSLLHNNKIKQYPVSDLPNRQTKQNQCDNVKQCSNTIDHHPRS